MGLWIWWETCFFIKLYHPYGVMDAACGLCVYNNGTPTGLWISWESCFFIQLYHPYGVVDMVGNMFFYKIISPLRGFLKGGRKEQQGGGTTA